MKKLSTSLDRISNWKSLLVLVAIYMFFNGYLLRNAGIEITALAGKPVGIIDLTFGFNPDKTLQMVHDYGDAARAYYARVETTIDVAYPVVYTLLMGIILSLLYRNTSYSWVNTIPFACMAFDLLENVTIVLLLTSYPQQSSTVAVLCEIFKLLKWLSFGAAILLVVFGVGARIKNRIKGNV
jgi:hypothetical protein